MVLPFKMLEDARDLINQESGQKATESRNRTIISRSFFAAYNQLLPWAEAHGFRFAYETRADRFVQLCNFLIHPNHPSEIREAGRRLSILASARHLADEVPYGYVTRDQAMSAMSDAARIIIQLYPTSTTSAPEVPLV